MKKENIYKLIEKSFGDKTSYTLYLNKFIEYLKDDGYLEMSEVITNIKNKNLNPSFSNTTKDESFKSYGSIIESETEILHTGYKHGIIKSIFLFGKPGTGKTTYVNKLAKLTKLPIAELRLSSIFDSRYGETIKRFEKFIENNISKEQILFIDEAEALFSKRGKNNDVFESDRLLTIMLKIMDKPRKSLVVLASNLINNIDKAILRRFDMFLNFDQSNIKISDTLKNELKKFSVEIKDMEINKIIEKMNNEIKHPNFSDINFIAKRITLFKLMNKSGIKKMMDYIDEEIAKISLSKRQQINLKGG